MKTCSIENSVLGLLLACALTLSAGATIVTTAIDEDDGNLTPGSSSGNGISLREAIKYSPAGTTITFDPAVFTGGAANTITLGGTELLIDKDPTIDASDLPSGITLDAQESSRVMQIASGHTVTLVSLTLTGGKALDGGGIHASGSGLTVQNSTVSGNETGSGGSGGGIYATSAATTITLVNATISANTASGSAQGGGITKFSNTLNSTNSIIAENFATTNPNLSGAISGVNLNNLVDIPPPRPARRLRWPHPYHAATRWFPGHRCRLKRAGALDLRNEPAEHYRHGHQRHHT